MAERKCVSRRGLVASGAALAGALALAFDNAWEEPYGAEDVETATFTCENGSMHEVELMASLEGSYLEGELACGFKRPYEDYSFMFVALLPNEGVRVEELVQSFTGETLQALLTSKSGYDAAAKLPKFSVDYSAQLVEQLRELGMADAFDADAADFSALGTASENIFIGQVVHKTHIEVSEEGTKAAAATAIGMSSGSSGDSVEPIVCEVVLDRPFVYLIVDATNNMPVFIGTFMR